MAGSTGLEPATSDVTGRRSNQTELTPQAVRGYPLLRELVYTDMRDPRKNFFQKLFATAKSQLKAYRIRLTISTEST